MVQITSGPTSSASVPLTIGGLHAYRTTSPPMQVWTRCSSRHPHTTDHASCLHPLSLFDGNCAHMNVNAGQAMAMVQNHRLSGEEHVLVNQYYALRRGGNDGCADWRCNVNAIVITAGLPLRIRWAPKTPDNRPVSGQRNPPAKSVAGESTRRTSRIAAFRHGFALDLQARGDTFRGGKPSIRLIL